MTASVLTLGLPLAQAGGFVREPGAGASSCVGRNDTICLGWAWDHLGDYVTPTLQHLAIVLASVAIGFAIAFALTLLSYRRRWLIPPFTGVTGVIYTIPSIALFLLLLPVTGRGNATAVIALCLYTLQIIYRNNVVGLANVPAAAKDAGRGMGMTDRQLLWKVELPLAVPEIIAGVRIATVSTVAIASLATFAGGDGLGAPLYFAIQQGAFKTGIFIPDRDPARDGGGPRPVVAGAPKPALALALAGLRAGRAAPLDRLRAADLRHRAGGPGVSSLPPADVLELVRRRDRLHLQPPDRARRGRGGRALRGSGPALDPGLDQRPGARRLGRDRAPGRSLVRPPRLGRDARDRDR